MTTNEQKLVYLFVFYDAACHLCSYEMEIYRRKDDRNRLSLIDISDPGFDAAAWGIEPGRVAKELWTLDDQGVYRHGVDSFVIIWRTLEINLALTKTANFRPARLLMDAGYKAFALIRPLLPRRRRCGGDNCYLRSNSSIEPDEYTGKEGSDFG